MKGSEQQLIKFFEGSEKRFIIPLYQRNYDWKETHCRQLFEDLITLHTTERKTHFFGSIVSCRANLCDDDWLIIDGQQRITTVSLILAALVNAAKSGDVKCDDMSRVDLIWETYLVDKFQEDQRKVKLKPIKKDMGAFDAILYNHPMDYVKESNVTRNYDFFYKKITTCGLTLEQLLISIKKLIVINIKLEADDNAQLIFESLNSTGLDLSEADKIRNFLLMSLSVEEQEQYYNQYWNKIEENTAYNPTMFIRDYLAIKMRRISNNDTLYFTFKDFVNLGNSREEVMKEMFDYSQYYKQIVTSSTGSKKTDKKLKQLNTLGSTVGMTFYMLFLKYAHDNSLSEDTIFAVFDVIENYWARRIICNLQSNALNNVFCTLHHDVMKILAENDIKDVASKTSYVEVLKYVLLKKQGSSAFPLDITLAEQFKHSQVYKMPIDYRYFLFERLENENNIETHDIVSGMKDGTITIEHIMPQTLNAEWREALGEDCERIHEEYLHTMANLTLTGYNSQYGNHKFEDKKLGYSEKKGKQVYGFNDSAYRLNNFLKDCDKWTEKELMERQSIMYNKFLGLWPMPTTDFKPNDKESETVALDEDEAEIAGRNIIAFYYQGIRHEVSSWKNMLIEVCKLVNTDHEITIKQMCSDENLFYPENSENCTNFAPGCSVYSSNSTQTKMVTLRLLFDKCNISREDLEFELVPNQDNQTLIEGDKE